jgi:methyltransferase (TIGR00027 family)
MKEGRPSTTAAWVAGLRGLASTRQNALIDDRIAEQLLPSPYRQILATARKFPRAFTAVHAFADLATGGRSQHLPLRTRAIDDAVKRAVEGGARQLVVLGAGLDARAWRLDVLKDVVVFEVDHPTMQAYKRPRVEGLPLAAREVRFVTSDFEREDLATRLDDAGYDPSVKSVYVWEGVTMYLSKEAIAMAVRGMAARSAPGSMLVATYFLESDRDRDFDMRALRWLLAQVSEPITATMTPQAFAALLSANGFDVVADEGDPEWTERYLGGVQPWTLERLVTALKR